MNDGYYRGAEPDSRDYADLAAIGIRTLVDLRGDDVDPTERLEAARAGLGYVQIPMTTHEVPTQVKLDEFLQIVTDPERQPGVRALRGRSPSHGCDDRRLPHGARWLER